MPIGSGLVGSTVEPTNPPRPPPPQQPAHNRRLWPPHFIAAHRILGLATSHGIAATNDPPTERPLPSEMSVILCTGEPPTPSPSPFPLDSAALTRLSGI